MLILGCDKGLIAPQAGTECLPCPLRPVTHVACRGNRLIAADQTHQLLWTGQRVICCDRGVEGLMISGGNLLTLSGETSALTLWDRDGNRLLNVAAGVYPSDFFRCGNMLAVCGGAAGRLLIYSLPGLHLLRAAAVPGLCQKVCAARQGFYTMCLTGYTSPSSLLFLCGMTAEIHHPIAELPGLPGALTPDGAGGCWAAAGEGLYHFDWGKSVPDVTISGFGLIHHLSCDGRFIYACDSLLDACFAIPSAQPHAPLVIYQGAAGQTAVMEKGAKKDAPHEEVRP